MKHVFISGILGNMGRRYAMILNRLGIKVSGHDKACSFTEQSYFCRENNVDGIIIATPTATHLDAINIFGNQNPSIPMLVEKPIRCGKTTAIPNFKITMVNQYKYLLESGHEGASHYNYFKTGNDGLYYDCINIIGMAKGDVAINNNSPLWSCSINGQKLNIGDMDTAYINMIDDWMMNPNGNREYFEEAHNKVFNLIEEERKQNKLKTNSETTAILEQKL